MLNIEFIKENFEMLIQKYNIDKTHLLENGAIYYMNGNDGTDFDYMCNDHACEFYIFWNSEYGAMKLYCAENKLVFYIYYDENDPFNHDKIIKEEIPYEYDLHELCEYLQGTFDDNGVYDQAIVDWNLSNRGYIANNNEEDDDYDREYVGSCAYCGRDIYSDEYYEEDENGNIFCDYSCMDLYD